MKKKSKRLWMAVVLVGILMLAVGYVVYINSPPAIILRGNPNAGTWNDDPENWNRAFGEDPPEGLSVVHSYYWQADHFTNEFIYFFEIEAPPQWLETFLKTREVEPVAAADARGFEIGYDETPDWFMPDPIENYEVWDSPGYHGSIWMNKNNNHIYFYGILL